MSLVFTLYDDIVDEVKDINVMSVVMRVIVSIPMQIHHINVSESHLGIHDE